MEPEEAARLIVLDAIASHTEVFVALAFLKLVDSDALHAFFGDALVVDDPVAAILAAAPAPTPPVVRTYEIVADRPVRWGPEATVPPWHGEPESPRRRDNPCRRQT